jgi:hypothetical protein
MGVKYSYVSHKGAIYFPWCYIICFEHCKKNPDIKNNAKLISWFLSLNKVTVCKDVNYINDHY